LHGQRRNSQSNDRFRNSGRSSSTGPRLHNRSRHGLPLRSRTWHGPRRNRSSGRSSSTGQLPSRNSALRRSRWHGQRPSQNSAPYRSRWHVLRRNPRPGPHRNRGLRPRLARLLHRGLRLRRIRHPLRSRTRMSIRTRGGEEERCAALAAHFLWERQSELAAVQRKLFGGRGVWKASGFFDSAAPPQRIKCHSLGTPVFHPSESSSIRWGPRLRCAQNDSVVASVRCGQNDSVLASIRCGQNDSVLASVRCAQNDSVLAPVRGAQNDSGTGFRLLQLFEYNWVYLHRVTDRLTVPRWSLSERLSIP